MQLTFVFFILCSIVVILGSFYSKFNSNQGIAGLILGLGFLGISIGFGIRWFTPSGNYTNTNPSGKWPPSINVCPDYLSLITLDGVKVCVDPVGVSIQNGTHGLKKWNGDSNTGTDYVFDLMLEKTGNLRVEALCNQCKLKGLTWEGVYDGLACMGNQPPTP